MVFSGLFIQGNRLMWDYGAVSFSPCPHFEGGLCSRVLKASLFCTDTPAFPEMWRVRCCLLV